MLSADITSTKLGFRAAFDKIYLGIIEGSLLHSLKWTLSWHNGCSRLMAAHLAHKAASCTCRPCAASLLSLGLLITRSGHCVGMDSCPSFLDDEVHCSSGSVHRGTSQQCSWVILDSVIEFDRGANCIRCHTCPPLFRFFYLGRLLKSTIIQANKWELLICIYHHFYLYIYSKHFKL